MKYFAYGSNMDLDRMSERGIGIHQKARATLEGHRLEFNKVASRNPKEGYANLVADHEGVVEGILYDIRDPDLSKLDRCERYPEHYDRIEVPVRLEDGSMIEAIVYVAQSGKIRDGLKPSREYLGHLLAGKEFLSETYFRMLQSMETLD